MIHEVEDAVYLLAPGKTCWLQALPAMLEILGLLGRGLLDGDYLCFADLAQDDICDPKPRRKVRKRDRGPTRLQGFRPVGWTKSTTTTASILLIISVAIFAR